MKINHDIALKEIEKKFGVIEQPVIYVSIAHSPKLVSMVKRLRTSLDFFRESPPDNQDIHQLQSSLEAIKEEYFGNQADSEYEPFSLISLKDKVH